MSNDRKNLSNEKNSGRGCLTVIIVLVILVILAIIGDIKTNDYELAGSERVVREFENRISENDLSSYEPPTSAETTGKANALSSAKDYIDIGMGFSRQKLIEQLEFEGYTNSEAVYGADNCGADWYDEAVKSAMSYLNVMPLSRQGLIEQLEFEGFTHDQAVYGAQQNGY